MKTKRIRIAVAMSRDGQHWSARSWDSSATPGQSPKDEVMKNVVLDHVAFPTDVHFVEADIPVPEIHSEAIEGKVVPEDR